MKREMTLWDLLLPYQRTFAAAPHKRKLWLSARQVGKSFDLAFMACRNVLSSPRGASALSLCISTGARASGEFLRKCAQMAEAIHVLEPSVTYTATSDCIRFSNGARVVSLPSGNPSALRGWTASQVVIDEAAYIDGPEDVWAAIAPTLTRDPDAELVVASTPAGKASWFYKLYEEARCGGAWYVQQTDIEEARRAGLAVDVEELRKTINDPDVWEMEYMCRFAEEYGAMLDCNLLDWYDAAPEFQARYLGMDVGSRSDRTAIATVGQCGGVLYVDDVAVMHKAEYSAQLEAVRCLHAKNAYQAGYVDETGIGSALAEWVTKQVTSRIRGWTFTAQNKAPMFEELRAGVFDHKVKFNRRLKELLVPDFSNVRRLVSEAGKVTYEAGRGKQGHSDATSAVVLALQAFRDMPAEMTVPSAVARPSSFGQWSSRLGGGVSLW